jgi:alpha-tubulin suppressor-like RCC1 family protein
MFLSNWLVFKIVLAAVTGLVDYPLAADVLLVYDNANKLYLEGNSIDYVSNVVLYKGETSYEIPQYPRIDFNNETKLTGETSTGNFGSSVSIDGDYLAITDSFYDSSDNGKIYIYHRSGTTWSLQNSFQSATSSDYMEAVAISGDYVMAGVRYGDDAGANAGEVLVYKRYGTTWTNTQTLTASDATAGDHFGSSITIKGNYAVVGTGQVSGAYIFTLSNGTWSETQLLTTGTDSDLFGCFVKLSDTDLLIGARGVNSLNGTAYIYTNNGGTFTQQVQITPDDLVGTDWFGQYGDIFGDYACVGAPYQNSDTGAAYIFKRSGTTWTQQQKLTASNSSTTAKFGGNIHFMSDDTLIIGAPYDDAKGANAGAAYLFQRTGDTWSEIKIIYPSNIGANDSFGLSISSSETDLVISGPTLNNAAGDVYLYSHTKTRNFYITQPGTYRADLQICGIDYKTNEVEVTGSIVPEKSFPSVSTKTYPSDGGTVSDSDYYGYVGLSGNGLVMVVVGKGDDDTTTDSGGFMVYEKINGVWTFTQQITNVGSGSATLGDCDEGKSVQLDYTGTRVFIGAHADDHSTTNSGSVYIYKRVAQGNWTLEQRIDGGGASYRYGYNDVNNDGDKLIIGSYGYPGSGNVGRAWYYTRSGTTWSLQDELVAPTTSAYGTSVGMNSAGTRAIIGGYNHSSNKGRADIWNYSGGSWSIGAGFTGENASDKFGWNVDMSNDGNTVVVGAPQYSSGGGEGRAYIYTTSDGTNWSLLKTLSNQTANEQFGFSVQISGDGNTVVIGAAKNDDGVTDGGRSYVYVKTNGTWPSTPTHTIIGTTANSNNGHTLGISDTGETIISGAPFDDDKGTNQGAVYIFDKKEIASLTFDGYNKLSLLHELSSVSSKLAYGSNVYDIGTLTSDITIEKQGEYASLTFDTSSNVAYFSNVTVDTVLDAPATRAFFHGNFVDTFSDGDATTAASNGRFYADMSETTTAFGTVSVTSSTSTSTTYQVVVPTELTGTNVLIVGGGGGGGTGSGWPTGGGGGEVKNLTNQTISAGTYTIVVGNGGGTNASGTNSSALGTTANPGTSASNNGGTSGSGNGPGSNYGQYEHGGGGGDASVGGNASDRTGGSGGDGSNVSWLDGSIYGEQVSGQAYFGGGGYSGDYTGSQTNGKGSGVPGTGGGGTLGGIGRSGVVAIYSSVGLGIKYLDFDTYNKLSIQNIIPTATTLKYGSNTYDLTTQTDIYIENTGTYDAGIKASDKFALVSNTALNVTEYSSTGLDTVIFSKISGSSWTTNSTITDIQLKDANDNLLTIEYFYFPNSNGGGGSDLEYINSSSGTLFSNVTDGSYSLADPVNSTEYAYRNTPQTDRISAFQSSTFNGYADGTEIMHVKAASGVIAKVRVVWDRQLYKQPMRISNNGKTYDITVGSNSYQGLDETYTLGGTYNATSFISFDTYKKLSIQNITPTSTTLKYGSNTYDIGTITDIYIDKAGTYEIESKNANTFVFSDNTVLNLTEYPYPVLDTVIFSKISGSSWTTSSTITDIQVKDADDNLLTIEYFYFPNSNGGGGSDLEYINSSSGTLFNNVTNGSYSSVDSYNGEYAYRNTPTTDRVSSFSSSTFNGYADGTEIMHVKVVSGAIAKVRVVWDRQLYKQPMRISNNGKTYDITVGSNSYQGLDETYTLGGTYNVASFMSFDTYNKLSFEYITPTKTTLKYGSNTYDLTTQTDIYIDKAGAYEAAITASDKFALVSNVVTGTISPHPTDAVPSLIHDGYNKLSIENITPTSTTLKYGSNTFDISTTTDIYIQDTGTYEIEAKSANAFVFASNVVSGTLKTVEPVLRAGFENGHALTYDGKLYAWGRNTLGTGELGVGDASNRTVPTLCTGVTQGQVAKFLDFDTSYKTMTWIKTTDNKIYATGDATNKQIPGHTTDLNTFTDVTSHFGDQSLSANNIIQVSIGSYACAGLTESGNVWTWGKNDNARGNLGNGGTTSSTQAVPAQITFNGATDNIIKLANGHDFTIALDNESNVWLWGTEWLGNTWGSASPIKMGTALDSITVTDISASYSSMYAISNTGVLYASGDGGNGQIMDGLQTDVTSSSNPDWKEVTYFSSNNITVNKVYPGTQYAGGGFVDTSDGWYAFGINANGTLGLGDTAAKYSPVKFTGVSNIKKFAVGYSTSHAVTEDGKYYAWGGGTNYARGDNTTGNIPYPKYIDTLPNILAPSFEFDGYDKVFVNQPRIQGQIVKFSKTTQTWSNNISITDVRIKDKYGNILPIEYIYFPFGDGGNQDLEYILPSDSMFSTVTDGSYSEVDCQPTGCAFRNNPSSYLVFVGFKSVYNTYAIGTEWMHVKAASGSIAQVQIIWDRQKYIQPTKLDADGMTYDIAEGNQSTDGGQDATYTLTGSYTSEKTSIYTKYTKDTQTYDANQAQIVTVSNPGTYDAQLSQGGVFSLKSATIPETKTSGLYTWAFHHGNFDNAYGDDDILTARDNGRFYADTPSYTGDIGTITANPNINSYTYTVSFKVINQSGTTIYDGTDGSIQFTMTEGVEYDTRTDLSTALDDAIDTALSGGGWSSHAITILGSSSYQCNHSGSIDSHTYTLGTLDQFHSRNGGTVSILITNPYYNQTMYTFTPASTLTANVLMVAGGGGGGGVNAGGGGAGGLVYSLNESISTGSKTIVVGNGGLGGEGYSNGIDEIGIRGNDTIFLSYTASGGGGGGSQDSSATTQIDGGSGGGNNGRYDSGIGGSSTQNAYSGKGFGNVGGDGVDDYNGGGGGGAGGAGTDATGNGGTGGTGGIGKYYGNIFGTNYGDDGWFAGGGGGASQTGTGTIGLGGKGGGGRGKEETDTYDIGFHGTSHTGGGGGATGYTAANSNRIGGSGGSGIVLLQTNVATPNVNSEVKIPEPHYHVLIEKSDDIQFSHLPNGIGSGTVHTGGSIVPNIPRADGSVSNVFYATSAEYFYAEQAGSLVSTVEGIFYPIEQQRYDNILEIGDNLNTNNNDVELEMAADGTAKLYRSHGADLIAAGTKVCFTVGKWHHIALTLDTGGNAVGYVNGYPVVSATYSSSVLPGSRREMCLYRTGVTATFQKFLMYYFKTYNSVLNHKQIMQLAGAAGLGPKLEYDGLNAINVVNTEPGSGTDITIYESNVNDTSNLYVVSCNESSYLLSNAGTYYAQIKGTDTFTITRPLTVTDDHFPLYQYPPIDGTTTGLTTSTTTATWTISGVQYSTGSSVAGSPYNTFDNSITSGFDSTSSTGDITITFESSKTIRKYIVWPYDSTSPVSTPGGNTDPTLSTDGTSRPKSWVLYGTNNPNEWLTVLDTVTNQPPSIYGDVHSISSPASYQYYKLSVTANNGGSGLKIGEWQLWGDA